MHRVAVLAIVFGCGRINFGPIGGDDGDGSTTSITSNIAFISTTKTMANFGGLVEADAICQADARAAGLDGTFLAFMSTQTVHARSRFTSSRGWVLADGTPLLDTMDGVFDAFVIFNALDRDAFGTRFPLVFAWTGTNFAGETYTGQTCADWQSSTASGAGGASTDPGFAGGGIYDCTNFLSLFCFEVGDVDVVTPTRSSGRIAFVSSTARTAGTGTAELDMICRDDASAAGLTGQYLAAVGTTSTAAASRFVVDARPWVRIDGTVIAGPGGMFAGSSLDSFLNQNADGTYTVTLTWTGVGIDSMQPVVSTECCADWNALGGETGAIGAVNTLSSAFWNAGQIPCTTQVRVRCFEQ